MQTWDDIRLDLLALGYRQIHFIEIECTDHGAFRAGVEEMLDTFACPRCGRSAEAAYLARGFTRKQTTWERVSPALSPRCKSDDQDAVARIQRHRPSHWQPLRGKSPEPETEHRVILYAFLRLQGVSQRGMRSALFPESAEPRKAKNRTAVFAFRHRDSIAEAERRLASLPLVERRMMAERARSQLARPQPNVFPSAPVEYFPVASD